MTIIQFPKSNKSSCSDDGPEKVILTLPVASQQMARIRFEPLDTPARAVPPAGALNWLEENLRQGANISANNIEGPGDPLGAIEATLETLGLVRRKYPGITLSVTTLGLHAEKHADSLARAGVSRVTLLVDCVDQNVADRLYAWIRPDRKTIPLPQATPMLTDEQQRAVKAFKKAGCAVALRTTVYPGINDGHIGEIAEIMAAYGADAMTLVACRISADREAPLMSPPDQETMQRLQKEAAKHLETTIAPAKENRIGVDCSSPLGSCKSVSAIKPKPTKARPNVAVVSSNGMEIDLHLGQACQVLIYGPRQDGLACLLETRPVPEPGSGSSRWEVLAETLPDCFAILAAGAGESPRKILGRHGISVLITENEIEGTVDVLYGGGKKGKKGKMS